MRRAKIVCTIGPSSRDEETLEKLIDAGMDVARINFSHGTYDEHRETYELIRKLGTHVAIMQDLPGPKIRVGEIDGGEMHLIDGETLTLTTRDVPGVNGTVNVTYRSLHDDVSPGDNIYLADGIIHLEVEDVSGEDVRCRIIHGGVLTARKGVNLPGVSISEPVPTGKDLRDLAFGLELGVDLVALSFIRTGEEIEKVQRLIARDDSHARVIAKIEKKEALTALPDIIDRADALMIARGDLGVEIPAEEVPVLQKTIIAECLKKGKPVITATQMLESMVFSERPTRAEASDVANAVIDGTDAVMLSAETAAGKYPVESVLIMDRIIRKVEEFGYSRQILDLEGLTGGGDFHLVSDDTQDALADAVCAGAVKICRQVGASAIACLTHQGRTARMLARYRPQVPIVALTDFQPAVKFMSLLWGVKAVQIDCIETTEKVFEVVREKVAEIGIRGKVVLTAGIPTKKRIATNTVHVVDI